MQLFSHRSGADVGFEQKRRITNMETSFLLGFLQHGSKRIITLDDARRHLEKKSVTINLKCGVTKLSRQDDCRLLQVVEQKCGTMATVVNLAFLPLPLSVAPQVVEFDRFKTRPFR